MLNEFFIVVNYEKDRRHHRHEALQSAIDEAARLAKKQPEETFVVMKPVTGRLVHLMPVEEVQIEEQ